MAPVCDDPLAKYKVCRVCGKPLSEDMAAWALRRFEQMCCSTECRLLDIKRRFACCDKADFLPCVCMYAFKCAEHGERHIGTHD